MKFLLYKFFIFLIFTITPYVLFGNNTSDVGNHTKHDTIYVSDFNNQLLLDYKKSIDEDLKAHREFISKLYAMIPVFLTILASVFMAILYVTVGKSKMEIKNLVDEHFNLKVDSIIKTRSESVEQEYSNRTKSFINAIHRALLEISCQVVSKDGDRPIYNIDFSQLTNKRILWVDNKPHNNVLHHDVFREFGVEFVLVKNSEDAIENLKSDTNFNLIISNLGRAKKNHYEENPREGLDFFIQIKELKIPKIIYTRPKNIIDFAEEAMKYGSITQGYTYLFKEIVRILTRRSSYEYMGKQ